MKATLTGLLLTLVAVSLVACKDEAPAPRKAEAKKEEARPLPPAAPTAAPAEGVKK